MNIKRSMSHLLLVTLLSAGLSAAGLVHASESAPADDSAVSAEKSGELYLPADDAMASLTAALDAARNSNRLLLVMMGANWCHDSRALASRVYEEPLSIIIMNIMKPCSLMSATSKTAGISSQAWGHLSITQHPRY